MNQDTLNKCKAEALRFLDRVADYDEATRILNTGSCVDLNKKTGRWSRGVERGAIKRASMDLTRALADLRQGR